MKFLSVHCADLSLFDKLSVLYVAKQNKMAIIVVIAVIIG